MRSYNLIALLSILDEHESCLHHGLAPNPFGFTFESTGDLKANKEIQDALDAVLEEMSEKELLTILREDYYET